MQAASVAPAAFTAATCAGLVSNVVGESSPVFANIPAEFCHLIKSPQQLHPREEKADHRAADPG